MPPHQEVFGTAPATLRSRNAWGSRSWLRANPRLPRASSFWLTPHQQGHDTVGILPPKITNAIIVGLDDQLYDKNSVPVPCTGTTSCTISRSYRCLVSALSRSASPPAPGKNIFIQRCDRQRHCVRLLGQIYVLETAPQGYAIHGAKLKQLNSNRHWLPRPVSKAY